jgi:hypothetical protein
MGLNCNASGDNSVAIGVNNIASGANSTALGLQTTASGGFGSMAMGLGSEAKGDISTAIGQYSDANGPASIAMGSYCLATGENSIAMGYSTVTSNRYSMAAGAYATAAHIGSFVWGDSTVAGIASTNANSVTMRASGGYRLFSNSGATAGVFLAPGGTSWSSISDRNAKKNFAPVDGKDILQKLAAIPVQQWNYKWESDDATPNIGPMAQDFKGAFYPGRDDKAITTQEFDGVELAAIQGLDRKVEEQAKALKAKDTQIANLEHRLADLEKMISSLSERR